MSPPRLRTAAIGRHLRASWLTALIVAGLFTMHGLGTHGDHENMTNSSATPVGHHSEAALVSSEVASPRVQAPTTLSDGLMQLCVALLSAGLLWVGRQRLVRRISRNALHAATPRGHQLPVLGRARAPAPDLLRLELCVCRC